MMVGPSGVGKGSIAARVTATDSRLWLSRSWTTRPYRPGEPIDAYQFVDRATFEAAVSREIFLEWAEVFGQLYGTPVPDPPPETDLLLEIDVQGAAQVKNRWPGAVVIAIVPPSRQDLASRLRGRGDDEIEMARRLARADEEETKARSMADHVVVNDELDRAVKEVAGIVESCRSLLAE
ncbi:MAG: guanylate kinase [Pseudonocardiaceae bacterium]